MQKNKNELYEDLKDRILLLARGITPLKLNGNPIFQHTSYAAGPQGKKFYIYSKSGNLKGMISIPIFNEDHPLYKYALKTFFGNKPSVISTENGIILKSVPIPKFMGMKLKDRTPFSEDELSSLHCYNTYTTVLAFKCKHSENHEECRYCEVDSIGKKSYRWPDIVPIEYIVDSLKIAEQSTPIRSITLTTGTFGPNDSVAERYFPSFLVISGAGLCFPALIAQSRLRSALIFSIPQHFSAHCLIVL